LSLPISLILPLVLVVLLVRENGPDINSLAVEVNYNYQPELVAADVKDDVFPDFVDPSKRLLELRKILKIGGPANL